MYIKGRGYNRKRANIRKNADNKFTAETGIKIIKLTGNPDHDCWVVGQKEYKHIACRKFAFALFNNWPAMDTHCKAPRLKNLRVKQSCGVHQCVNPDHLIGTEPEYDPLAGWK